MATPEFQLKGLDHVVLRVKDAERMMAFYCDVLGCTMAKHNEPLGLYHLLAGNSMIDLVTIDGALGKKGGVAPGAEGRNVDHIAVKVSHFDAAAIRAHLASHNIDAGEAVIRFGAEGDGPSIYVTDPEGNGVELKAV